MAAFFTVKGSGNKIGNTSDQFQFAFINLAGDEDFTAHLTSLDLNGSLAGIMMRDSVSDTSPFAYIAIKAGSRARSLFTGLFRAGMLPSSREMVTLAAPIYLRLSKSQVQHILPIHPHRGLRAAGPLLVRSQSAGFGTQYSLSRTGRYQCQQQQPGNRNI